jgi:hypothetical protein
MLTGPARSHGKKTDFGGRGENESNKTKTITCKKFKKWQ